jgi:hypothetical protein
LKLGPTLALLAGMAVLVLSAMTGGLLAALVLAGLFVLTGLPAVLPWQGRTLYAAAARRWAWRRQVKSLRHLYRSGLAGVSPDGLRRLPGLLAAVATWRAVDATGRDYALVQLPAARQWAVVLRVAAQAGALVDADTRDSWVAGWGEYLAQLGAEGGVVQAAAVVETAPDAGALLSAHVTGLLTDEAPAFARQVLADAAAELPTGVTETLGHVTLTFSERALGIARSRDRHVAATAVAEEVGRRLPGLCAGLKATGTSAGEPLTVDGLARRVREAYDPAAALGFAEASAGGEPITCAWADSGPAAAEESATAYRHDSGLSRSWEALAVPPGVIRDGLLERLTGPAAAAPRKRVTLLYRPVDAADTALVVDRDLRAAINREGRRQGVAHAHDTAQVRAAQQAAAEEADGAGVVSFSVLVTVTVPAREGDAEVLERASSAVERAARGARVRLSPVYGSQAAAFAGGLGIGLSLPDLALLPAALRPHF